MAGKNHKKLVFVGLSGGVDSAVSAALLKKEGYDVVGVFIKTWHPDFLICNEEEERRDAMRVAAHLNIPFLTFDLSRVYKREVGDYMINEYRAGRTPNPDVMCNKEVKFGAFLKKALAMGADFVATGHYALLERDSKNFAGGRVRSQGGAKPKNLFNLWRSKDPAKDQSYFLWTLRQAQLRKILFPIGNLRKTEVRKIAQKLKLPVAEKKDSQGICFLGAVDLKEFLKHYIREKKGKVLNEKGETIGYHNGVIFLTEGERHGFTITRKTPKDGPYYVTGRDVKKNILYVSQGIKALGPLSLPHTAGRTFRQQNPKFLSLAIKNTNWISKEPKTGNNYTAQIRYHGEHLPCNVKNFKGNKAEVIFKEPVLVASGQSCVIYNGDICLGGGVAV